MTAISQSAVRRLDKADHNGKYVHRHLSFRAIKMRLEFEQAMGFSGSASTKGMTPSARASTAQKQQQTVGTLKAKIKTHRPRELQSYRSMSFQDFCSTVEVRISVAAVVIAYMFVTITPHFYCSFLVTHTGYLRGFGL